MFYKSLFYFLFLMLTANGLAQSVMTYKDGKQYKATDSWKFICENYALTGNANIQIAKAEKGGVLQISVDTTNPSFFIGGSVYIDLEDNTFIICTDKNLRQSTENGTTAWYIFTPSEMAKLKTTSIAAIRFYIKGIPQKFSSQIGHFTAVNKKAFFSISQRKPEKFETASEVNSLYL